MASTENAERVSRWLNKSGRSLVDLAKELERQKESKRDVVVESSMLRAEDPNGGLRLLMPDPNGGEIHAELTEHAHRQLAEKCGIPWAYYERVRGSSKGALPERNGKAWIDGTG